MAKEIKTKEELAKAIRDLYKGYSNMVMGMTPEDQEKFDAALKTLVNDEDIV